MTEAFPWSSLAGVPRLTSEFFDQHAEIIRLLNGNWLDSETRKSVADRVLSSGRPHDLGKAIRSTYSEMEIPPAVERNLDALDDPDTLAVVTGQQPGLFGGPLYTFYKALSAILISRELERDAPGRVVPIFWIESADADFSEVSRIGFPSPKNHPYRASYTPLDTVAGRSIRYHQLNGEIEPVRKTIIDWMDGLPYQANYAAVLERTCRTGRYLVDCFRELMTALLGDSGLIMIDPLHPALRNIFNVFWEKCLTRPEKINKSFAVASREIESFRLPLQVRLREGVLPIYLIDSDGMRHRLHGSKSNWQIGQKPELYTNDQLLDQIKDESVTFSPGVLLRPLYQDWLLPTWIYVGGPSEIAYHAQIGRAYDSLEIPRPLVTPRISVTLVEASTRRLLNKHGWKVVEVLGGREILLRSSGRSQVLSDLFDKGMEQLKGWLERIDRASDEASLNIAKELEQGGRKLSYQWDKLHRLAVDRLNMRDQVRTNHAEKLLGRLLPDGMLQERHNNVLYYLAYYGERLVQTLETRVDIYKPLHYVIDLEVDR